MSETENIHASDAKVGDVIYVAKLGQSQDITVTAIETNVALQTTIHYDEDDKEKTVIVPSQYMVILIKRQEVIALDDKPVPKKPTGPFDIIGQPFDIQK